MESHASTLYDRLGAAAGVQRFLHEFYDRLLRDQRIAGFFRDVPLSNLIRMQAEFFTAALDGPQAYGGRRITAEHFNMFCQHPRETLEAHDDNEEFPDDESQTA